MTATAARDHFRLSGEFLTEHVRARVLEGAWRRALRLLVDDLPGMTYEQAISILAGTHQLIGDSDVGLDLVPETERPERTRYLETVSWQWRFVYHAPGDQHWQPYAIVDNWGPHDIPELPVRRSPWEPQRYPYKSERSNHYLDDPRHDQVVLVGPDEAPVHYLVKPVEPPVWLRFPGSLADVVAQHAVPVPDDRPALPLPRTGHLQWYVPESRYPKPAPVPAIVAVTEPAPAPPRLDPAVPRWPGGFTSSPTRSLASVQLQPPVRKFPHPGCPRRVDVTISSWVGTAPGARHWYAQLQEECNPVWDGVAGCWFRAADDVAGQGRHFPPAYDLARQEFVDQPDQSAYDQARAWVQALLAEHFTGPEYEISWQDCGPLTGGARPYQPYEGD